MWHPKQRRKYNVKTLNQRKHAKRRAIERYGVYLNRHQLRDIALLIREGKSVIEQRMGRNRSIHLVEYEEKKFRVVYDRKRVNVATFLPLEDSEEYERKKAKRNENGNNSSGERADAGLFQRPVDGRDRQLHLFEPSGG